jgi:hypothetical protein
LAAFQPCSLARTLNVATPHLPADLVPPAARDRLVAVCERLPATLTRRMYLECRLAGDGGRVDLIVRVDRHAAGILAGRDAGLDPALRETPPWRRLSEVARCWIGEPRLWEAVAGLWLEFDLPECGSFGGLQRPRAFVEPERAWLAAAPEAELAPPVLALLRPLVPQAPEAAWSAVARALRRWRAGVPYLGADPGSTHFPLRLCLATRARSRLVENLRDLGWPEADRLDAALPASLPLAAPTLTHVDLGDRPGPTLGVEATLARRPQLSGRIAEGALLDELVARGLCSPGRRRALEAWPGHSITSLAHEIWTSLVTRRVNNVKLLVTAGGVAAAKGYLCFAHGFWRPAE